MAGSEGRGKQGRAREQKTSAHIVQTKKKLVNQADKQEEMPSHQKAIKSSTSSTSQASKTQFKQPRGAVRKVAPSKSSWTEAERSRHALEENLSGLFSQLGCS